MIIKARWPGCPVEWRYNRRNFISVLATATAYGVYIMKPGQVVVAGGPKRSTGGLQGDNCSETSNKNRGKLLAIQRKLMF